MVFQKLQEGICCNPCLQGFVSEKKVFSPTIISSFRRFLIFDKLDRRQPLKLLFVNITIEIGGCSRYFPIEMT